MTTRDSPTEQTHAMRRRDALKCLATWSGAAVMWTVVSGVPRALGATNDGMAKAGSASALNFVQISDTHIGFRKQANPDVVGSLRQAIAAINALPQAPAFVVHTGDVSHLSKAEEFAAARDLLQELRVDRVHTVPGEHDTIDGGVAGYLEFFDHDRNGRSWYSFDQGGVHFVGLNNVQSSKARLRSSGTSSSHGSNPTSRASLAPRRSLCSRISRCGRSGSPGDGEPRIRSRRSRCCVRSDR